MGKISKKAGNISQGPRFYPACRLGGKRRDTGFLRIEQSDQHSLEFIKESIEDIKQSIEENRHTHIRTLHIRGEPNFSPTENTPLFRNETNEHGKKIRTIHPNYYQRLAKLLSPLMKGKGLILASSLVEARKLI